MLAWFSFSLFRFLFFVLRLPFRPTRLMAVYYSRICTSDHWFECANGEFISFCASHCCVICHTFALKGSFLPLTDVRHEAFFRIIWLTSTGRWMCCMNAIEEMRSNSWGNSMIYPSIAVSLQWTSSECLIEPNQQSTVALITSAKLRKTHRAECISNRNIMDWLQHLQQHSSAIFNIQANGSDILPLNFKEIEKY